MASSPVPSKTLVLLFDGTRNFFKQENTNVVRLFSALENNKPDEQLLYYQPGFGTNPSPSLTRVNTFSLISKVVDKALACFLSDHILRGYGFLMQNYRPGDRICMFGFGRGAYTARALAGMIYKVGLLSLEDEKLLSSAWKHYKDSSKSGRVRAAKFKPVFSREVDISYVGVWETPANVGMFGRHLPFTRYNPGIRTFRHAVALDERRIKFQPNVCAVRTIRLPQANEPSNPQGSVAIAPEKHGMRRPPRRASTIMPPLSGSADAARPYGPPKVFASLAEQLETIDQIEEIITCNEEQTVNVINQKEVWFAGCHTDVGGCGKGSGLLDDGPGLPNVSLRWMVQEAVNAQVGLMFRADAFPSCPDILTVQRTQGAPEKQSQESFAEGESAPASSNFIQDLADALDINVSGIPTADKADRLSKAWFQYRKDLLDPSKNAPIRTKMAVLEERANVRDACAPMHDKLQTNRAGWILEYFPIWETRVRHDGCMSSGLRWNRGRGRAIPAGDVLIHSSVLARQSVLEDYKPRATWEGAAHYVE